MTWVVPCPAFPVRPACRPRPLRARSSILPAPLPPVAVHAQGLKVLHAVAPAPRGRLLGSPLRPHRRPALRAAPPLDAAEPVPLHPLPAHARRDLLPPSPRPP